MDQFEINHEGKEVAKQKVNVQKQYDKTYDECEGITVLLMSVSKVLPLVLFLILKFATTTLLPNFFVTVVLISVDFWLTKNHFGNKLAGLRWYSKTEQSGERWFFESSQSRMPYALNTGMFWGLQIFVLLAWTAMFLMNIFIGSPTQLFLALLCCFLLAVNTVFYLQCKGTHQQTLNVVATKLGINVFQTQSKETNAPHKNSQHQFKFQES